MGFDSKRKADLFVVTEGPDGTAPRAAKGSPITKPSRVANQTDVDRLVSAKARCIVRSKESSADPQYGAGHAPSYWEDFAGSETSNWDASVLVCFAQILEAPILKRSKSVWTHDLYDPRTGLFNLGDAAPVSIQELRSAIDARIVELGMSKVEFYEWYFDHQSGVGQEYWRFHLPLRVQKNKEFLQT